MRRPTATDRNIAQRIMDLPLGHHEVRVELEDGRAYEKAEGMMIVWIGNKRISIVDCGPKRGG